jgi:hypothetical protein
LNPLPQENLLSALGEVSAAFVGFSLVVGILRDRSSDTTEDDRSVSPMRDVAEIGLTAVGASFLPLVINDFGASPETTWRLASATVFVAGIVGAGFSIRRQRAAILRDSRYALIGILNLGSFGLLLSNVLVVGPTSGARYSAVVLLVLTVAGVLFVSTTFRRSRNPPVA